MHPSIAPTNLRPLQPWQRDLTRARSYTRLELLGPLRAGWAITTKNMLYDDDDCAAVHGSSFRINTNVYTVAAEKFRKMPIVVWITAAAATIKSTKTCGGKSLRIGNPITISAAMGTNEPRAASPLVWGLSRPPQQQQSAAASHNAACARCNTFILWVIATKRKMIHIFGGGTIPDADGADDDKEKRNQVSSTYFYFLSTFPFASSWLGCWVYSAALLISVTSRAPVALWCRRHTNYTNQPTKRI